jgi:Protein of unknown function (DUF3619)
MNRDDEFAKKLAAYLNSGATDLKTGTAYRLQQARKAALERMAGSEASPLAHTKLAHAFAGNSTGGTGPSLWKSGRLWLGILVIALAGFGWQQWMVYQQTREIEEIDAQILASELPIDAYLDRGFQNWLSRREP